MNKLVAEFSRQKLLKGRKCVVVGAGRSGVAAARLLLSLGSQVAILDSDTSLAQETALKDCPGATLETGEHRPEQFLGTDIVVLSPGVPIKKLAPVLKDVPPRKLVAEMELGSWFAHSPILAVTGTNGKTTTTTLISHILEQSGKRVFTGGNIGTPLCDHLMDQEEEDDVLVIEISSFQLQNCNLFQPKIGILLNVSPNHLDYHEDMEEYLSAKLKLFARQSESDTAILPLDMKQALEERDFTKARKVYFQATDRFDCPGLPGEHNKANIEAAWQALSRFGISEDQFATALKDFTSLDHRIQPLGEKNGVLFVDDSKGTNLDAMAAAIKSFDRPIHLLAGGVFKGGDVKSMIPVMSGRVKEIGLFGDSREVFEEALAKDFSMFWEADLEKAVKRLFKNSEPGDVILLSPATASFDLYSSYGERGDDFKRIFKEL